MPRALQVVMLVGLLTACGEAPTSQVTTQPAASEALRCIPGVEPPPPPLVEVFKGEPGCIVACYKKYEYAGQVNRVQIPGVLRVEGSWDAKHICIPQDARDEDISRQDSRYSRLCTQEFPDVCPDAACWAGGDTFAIATRIAREHKLL